jgi:hypothetical protein
MLWSDLPIARWRLSASWGIPNKRNHREIETPRWVSWKVILPFDSCCSQCPLRRCQTAVNPEAVVTQCRKRSRSLRRHQPSLQARSCPPPLHMNLLVLAIARSPGLRFLSSWDCRGVNDYCLSLLQGVAVLLAFLARSRIDHRGYLVTPQTE